MLTQFLGKMPIVQDINSAIGGPAKIILDLIYEDNAVILENVNALIPVLPINIPFPLIGFKYKILGELEIAKFAWSEYPYLNKRMTVNASIQQVAKFSVQLIDPIYSGNSVVKAITKRNLLMRGLEQYALAGGMVTVNTQWCTLTHCIIERIAGVQDQNTQDGNLFRIDLIKPNFSESIFEKILGSVASAFSSGGVF